MGWGNALVSGESGVMDNEHAARAKHQLHASLERVKVLLTQIQASGSPEPSQTARQLQTPFTLKPCLTPDELTTWETINQLLLPEAYRLFLLEIGGGFTLPGAYCDFKIRPLEHTILDSRLREPFPITNERFQQRMAQLQAEGRSDDALFPELSQYDIPPGCLILGHYPSYDTIFLVVSGELYGTVWCAVESGVPELDPQETPFDFLSWFEDTVSELSRAE